MISTSSKEALRHMLTIVGVVFIGESFVMLILDQFPRLSDFDEAVADASLLSVILVPVFYWLLYKPMRSEIHDRRVAERQAVGALQEADFLNKSLLQAQEQLLVSEKMVAMGHLAAGVAHEINNPIGFVGSNLFSLQTYTTKLLRLVDAYEAGHDLLATDAERFAAITALRQELDIGYLRADLDDLLTESTEGIDRVKRIVRDLKDFSRADDGVWEDADINAELERTLNVVHNELKYHVEIVKQLGDLPKVHCIAPQLNQVFLNLLVNAGQAIEDKGTITISSWAAADHVLVAVADTGCGMTEAQMKKSFDAFYTTKPRGKGTGLGLSVSSGIIEKHHGRIEVQSTPGVGTTFTVHLPIRQPAVEAPPQTTAP